MDQRIVFIELRKIITLYSRKFDEKLLNVELMILNRQKIFEIVNRVMEKHDKMNYSKIFLTFLCMIYLTREES